MREAHYCVFDCETTGIDVFNDRIVQLVAARADRDGKILSRMEWIIDPGVEVPQEAAEVHGLSTEYLTLNGEDSHKALWEADQFFKQAIRDNLIFVAYNLNFDLSIITAEMARHSLGSRYGNWVADNVRLFDPLVVDRAKDRYRKGPRKLLNVAQHYGIDPDPDKLHDAGYDVEVTAQVASAVEKRYGVPTNTEQAQMYRDWATGFEKYLQKEDATATVDKDWPTKKEER